MKKIFVEYKDRRVGVTNLLSQVSLKVKQGHEIKLHFEEPIPAELEVSIRVFFTETEQVNIQELEADRLLMENSVIMQEAIFNLPNGMIVVNSQNIITFVNDSAIRFLEIPSYQLLNKRAAEVIPHSKLHEILQTGETRFAEKQMLKMYTILANRAPIFLDGKIIGAVAIFQDITDFEKINSELRRERELQEKLNLVLDSVIDFNYLEILPRVIPSFIKKFSNDIKIPILAGGLVTTKEEVNCALSAGAQAVTTSHVALWQALESVRAIRL